MKKLLYLCVAAILMFTSAKLFAAAPPAAAAAAPAPAAAVAPAAAPAAAVAPAAATAAAPADVAGTWEGTFAMPDGSASFPLSFTFKQDGTKLTGSVASAQGGDPIPITEGKVDGNKIFFKVSFNGTTITHQGTVTGDAMKLTSKSDSADFPGGEIDLKRAKTPTP